MTSLPVLRLLVCGATLVVVAQRGAARAMVSIPGISAVVLMDTLGEAREVDGPFGRVYHATVLAFQGLKIPLDVTDSTSGLVGNLRLVQSRRIAGTNLSQFLSCGSSITGPRADSYRLTMPLVVLLDRLPGDRTRVRVALLASARDMAGNSTEPVPCTTTGALEERIRKSIDQHLAASVR
jgi:hypothetical protein